MNFSYQFSRTMWARSPENGSPAQEYDSPSRSQSSGETDYSQGLLVSVRATYISASGLLGRNCWCSLLSVFKFCDFCAESVPAPIFFCRRF